MTLNFTMQTWVDRLPWSVSRRLRSILPPPQGYNCCLLNINPPIVLIPEDFYDHLDVWTPFFDALATKKIYFICWVPWNLEAHASTYKQWFPPLFDRHRARYPKHQLLYLANNSAQQEVFNELGLRSIVLNDNALVDEKIFSLIEGAERKYDAIYNAAMMPYKRHHLATQIRNLALITYVRTGHDEYVRSISNALGDATWLNFDSQKPDLQSYKSIPKVQVARYLNQAKVGLCLSEQEGAMFASVEYLLCGLPIVSTPSVGGRDTFFDEGYVEIVDATPEAVNQGVLKMLERRIPPDEIRQKTLRKFAEHRNRLIDLMVTIYHQEGMHVDREELYARIFSEELLKVRELHRIAAQL